MKRTLMVLATASLFIGTAAQADIAIDARQVNQARQIDAGKRSGRLTRNERDILTNEQRRIKRVERRYARGGISEVEERALSRMLDRSQAHIVRLKNNRVRTRGSLDI